jgi:hypothetical protein
VLAGASGPTAIGEWAALKGEFLLNTLDLPNGIPRKDVFRRVLMTLRPGAFWPAPHFLVHLKWEFLDRLHRYINHQTVIRLSVLLLSHDALNSFGVA